MNRWLVLLAMIGACAIEPVAMQASELDEPSNGSSGSDGGVHDAVHEGGMGSDAGSGSGVHDAGSSGSDGSGSDGSGSGSDGSGVGVHDAGESGGDVDASTDGSGNGGDDGGIRGINNDSDARTNFYACAGCGTSNPSQAGVLAFGVLIVLRRRRR